jgi:hypothetical protein
VILGFEFAGKEEIFWDVIRKEPGKVVFLLDGNGVIC